MTPESSVVHLIMRKRDIELSIGTGVLYKRAGSYFIATAWHNLGGRDSYTFALISTTGAVPDNVLASISLQVPMDGGREGGIRFSFVIPLEDDTTTHYWVHPEGWPRIDVAVIPITPENPYPMEGRTVDDQVRRLALPMQGQQGPGGIQTRIQSIQDCAGTYSRIGVEADGLIDPGDDLFVLGYPKGITDYMLEPIWKRATVASDPHRGREGGKQFLIDCASRDGMSGAPVITYTKTGTVQVGGKRYIGTGPSAALHGVYVGRIYDPDGKQEDRLFEASIGRVWKRAVIDEIIDGRELGAHSSRILASDNAIKAAVRASWPAADGYAQKVLAHEYHRWHVVDTALKALRGNAKPHEVLDTVMAYAAEMAGADPARKPPDYDDGSSSN